MKKVSISISISICLLSLFVLFSCVTDRDSEFLENFPKAPHFSGGLQDYIELVDILFDFPKGRELAVCKPHGGGRVRDRLIWSNEVVYPLNLLGYIFQKEMLKVGYPIKNGAYSFSREKEQKARYSIKLIVSELFVEDLHTDMIVALGNLPLFYLNYRDTTGSMKGSWIIWDNDQGEEVLRQEIAVDIEENDRQWRDIILRLFEKFAITGLANQEIYDILNFKKEVGVVKKSTLISLPVGERQLNMNREGSSLFDSIALVVSEGVRRTGFYVSEDGYLLTSDFETYHSSTLDILDSSMNLFKGEVVARDLTSLTCLVKVDLKGGKVVPIPLRKKPISEGESLYLVGFASSGDSTSILTSGTVGRVDREDYVDIIQTDASANDVTYGGPMVDSDGNGVALISYKMVGRMVEDMTIGVSLPWIFDRLNIQGQE